ncbi:MAG: Ig-like domain-containing protein, partial [Anaerolineales bacterium]|nr:Ig-like domain-containing protein [Anaerolineales bacterium]
RYPEGGGPTINSGEADLTLDGTVNVPDGGILSSGGTVTFGAGSSGASFTDNSGMMLEDTILVLETALDLPYLHFTGTSSFQTNGNTLNLKYLEIGVQNELDLTNVVTSSESYLNLLSNSAITKTGDLVFKQISLKGYTLTLNPAITGLTAKNIYLPNYDSNSPNYNANTGLLNAQGVDVTLRKQIYLTKGTIQMGGGTLTLEQGGYIQEDGVLDVSNSVLSLSGPFFNYNATGTLTTSASTLRLNANVKFDPYTAVTFDTYEPNGWGLVMQNSDSNLTIGGDVTLKPNEESLTSGFVDSYIYPTDNTFGLSVTQIEVSDSGNISVTFNSPMDLNYITTNEADTECRNETIQVSSDDFSTCVRMPYPESSSSNTTFTLDPVDNLANNTTYKIRVTTGVKDSAGNNLSSQYTSNGFTWDNSGTILTSPDIEVMDTESYVVGIETNQASLSINGSVTLQDNATISSDFGEVSLGILDLEYGNIRVSGGTLRIAGAGSNSVGASGQVEVGEQGSLILNYDLAVSGTLNLNDGA